MSTPVGRCCFSVYGIVLRILCTLWFFSALTLAIRSPDDTNTDQNDHAGQRLRRVAKRQLFSVNPSTPIPPTLVDLWDRVANLEEQLKQATLGTPRFTDIERLLNSTEANLLQRMQGSAVFITSAAPETPTPTPTPTSTSTSPLTVVTTTRPGDIGGNDGGNGSGRGGGPENGGGASGGNGNGGGGNGGGRSGGGGGPGNGGGSGRGNGGGGPGGGPGGGDTPTRTVAASTTRPARVITTTSTRVGTSVLVVTSLGVTSTRTIAVTTLITATATSQPTEVVATLPSTTGAPGGTTTTPFNSSSSRTSVNPWSAGIIVMVVVFSLFTAL